MKKGLDAVLEESRCGIPRAHLEAMIEAANRSNMAIGVRRVNPFAKKFIEEGCPSKSFAIKNKSADSGPMIGLIPIDPSFGRCSTDTDVKKHKDDLDHAYEAGENLVKMDLFLDQDYLVELTTKLHPKFKMMKIEDDNYLLTWINQGKEIHGYAKRLETESDNPIFQILDADENPIQVLGKTLTTGETKPITADYDLLITCHRWEELEPGGRDRSPFRTQGTAEVNKDKVSQAELIRKDGLWLIEQLEAYRKLGDEISFEKYLEVQIKRKASARYDTLPLEYKARTSVEQHILAAQKVLEVPHLQRQIELLRDNNLPSEHPKKGNVSVRMEGDIESINEAIGRGTELDMVHHNAECLNPFASDLDFPLYLFLPQQEAGSGVVLIENIAELVQQREELIDAGYYWPTHAKYRDTLMTFKQELITTLEQQIKSPGRLSSPDDSSGEEELPRFGR